MQTLVEPGIWTACFNEAWSAVPELAGLKLRWRPSFRGGRPIAQPAATAQKLQRQKKATAAAGKGQPQHTAEVNAARPRTYDPLEFTQVVVGLLHGNGLALAVAPEAAIAAPGQRQAAS